MNEQEKVLDTARSTGSAVLTACHFSRVYIISSALLLTVCCFRLEAQALPTKAEFVTKIAGAARTICWNHDDRLFALGTADFISIRDIENPRFDYRLPFSPELGLYAFFDLAHNADMVLGISSERMAIWKLPTSSNDISSALYEKPFEESGTKEKAVCATFSHDNAYIAVAFEDGSIKVYNRLQEMNHFKNMEFSLIIKIKSTMPDIRGLSFSPDSQFIAAVSGDGSIRIWNRGNGSPYSTISSFSGMQSPPPRLFSRFKKHLQMCAAE